MTKAVRKKDNSREDARYPLPEEPKAAVLKAGAVAGARIGLRGRSGIGRTHLGGGSALSSTIHAIKQGYSIEEFNDLKTALGTTGEELARLAGISPATMHRRKAAGRLTPDESDKIFRLRRLYETAMEVLESEETVKAWFNTPQRVFDEKKPLEYMETLPGCEEVERVLRRVEHGIIQ